MKARDGPEMKALVEKTPTAADEFSTAEAPLIGTRSSKTANAVKPRGKLPKNKRGARPPRVNGYSWRKDGAGWELRKAVYEPTGTGTKKRRRPYVAHLSKSAFGEMKRRHKGAALERAIAEWIAEHDK